MGEREDKTRRKWIAPALVAVLTGACYCWLSKPFTEPQGGREVVLAAGNRAEPAGPLSTNGNSVVPGAHARPGNPVALEYAAAVQEGRLDDVVRLTCWMQDRLERLRAGAASTEEIAAASRRLQARSRERIEERNQLRPEGVEDHYVFSPGATVEVTGIDEGRDDLERPVKNRTWLRVTYGDRLTALRDEDGLPVKSLVVGVNISEDGLVLKANVVGNLEIDFNSIQTGWIGTSKESGHGAGKLPAV